MELFEAASVIISLVLMEALLSVDNAMVLAAMVSHLPAEQKRKALTYGLLGAYVFRGATLLVVSFLIANPWVKVLGACYLIYVMCEHLGHETAEGEGKHRQGASFWGTIVQVELADLAFSIDNVIAAVALTKNFWLVVTGVFIGILAMRFVAGFFVKLMDRYPILKPIAYVLVGLVGGILLLEHFLHFDLHGPQKLGLIAAVIVAGLVYDRVGFLRTVFGPLFRLLGRCFGLLASVANFVFWPVSWVVSGVTSAISSLWRQKDPDNK